MQKREGLHWFKVSSLATAFTLATTITTPILADDAKTFGSPDEAVSSLVAAVKTQNPDALKPIFGPESADIENPDRVQGATELANFGSALDQGFQLAKDSSTKYVLEIGTNHWPFPIPIVHRQGRWLFDTTAGKEELLNRRIGKNELAALEVVRAYVDAQREYAARDRDGDQVLEYAQKIASSPGQMDGLYWDPGVSGEMSPLGPMVARAQGEGYFGGDSSYDAGPQPFHGYLFKILTRQGKNAAGGKYDYIINGNMIGGFAMVAWPARYDDSGIMTFIVNQQGRVYQKDLGADTDKLVRKMKAYDPDPGWQASPD
jgi:ABC-type cobalt transport system substrate-binding protein